jgi:hypothetical protein
MASWSFTGRMDKNRPVLRVTPDGVTGCNLRDFWDDTNKRYKSGVVVVTITSITLSTADGFGGTAAATYTTGETLAVAIQPPNYNALNDTQYLNSGVQVASGAVLSGAPLYKNVIAVNYGVPGPSATLNPDDTIDFTAIDLVLSSNAFTDITSTFGVVVAGTLTFTEYSPYADTGGTAYELDLTNGPLSYINLAQSYAGAWGMIAAPIQAGYAAIVVQLQTLTSGYIPGAAPDMTQPSLTVSNPAQAGGQQLANVRRPIPMDAKKTFTFVDGYTYIFGVNNNLIDANGVQIGSVDIGVTGNTAYNLCNAGVQSGRGTATAKLAYKTAIHGL